VKRTSWIGWVILCLVTPAMAGGVDALLQRQADLEQPWDVDVDGGRMETLRAAGKVTNEQWRQFAINSLRPRWRIRPHVRQGDVLPVMLVVEDRLDRGGPSSGFELTAVIESLKVGEHSLDLPKIRNGYHVRQDRRPRSSGTFGPILIGFNDDVTSELPVGTHDVMLTAKTTLKEVLEDENNLLLSQEEVMFKTDLRVDAADDFSSLLVTDDELADGVAGANRVGALVPTESVWRLRVDIWDTPVATKWVVLLRPAGGTNVPNEAVQHYWQQTSYFEAGAKTTSGRLLPTNFLGFEPANHEKVDVILVPDLKGAAETLHGRPIWGKRLVIEDVAVLQEDPGQDYFDMKVYSVLGRMTPQSILSYREWLEREVGAIKDR
jgi:hypothetical protein